MPYFNERLESVKFKPALQKVKGACGFDYRFIFGVGYQSNIHPLAIRKVAQGKGERDHARYSRLRLTFDQ